MTKLNFFKLFTVLIALLLAGCGTTIQERVVIKTEIRTVKIPDTLLTPCEVTVPPQRETYINSNTKEKEKLLTDFSIDLLKDLRLCNAQIKKIRDLHKEQVKAIEDSQVK